MSWRRTQPRDIELEPRLSPADATLERLRPRLMVATQEELVALVERLAGSSEELAARIDYVPDPSAAAKALYGVALAGRAIDWTEPPSPRSNVCPSPAATYDRGVRKCNIFVAMYC
jgi:hypothetical protein